MAKKSIRYIKKKFKAMQMLNKMECLAVMPTFVANAKMFYEILDFLGVDLTFWSDYNGTGCDSGMGLDHKVLFNRDLEKVMKAFPPAFQLHIWDSDVQKHIMNSIMLKQSEREDLITKPTRFGLMNHNIKLYP